MKYVKYVFLISLFLFKGVFFNIINNINTYIFKNDDQKNAELNIIKEQYNDLKKEYDNLTSLKLYTESDYSLTRLSYRKNYNYQDFYIYGGMNNNYNEGDILINYCGVVGVIKKVNKDYSECKMLTGLTNLSVKINESYGTLKEYKDGLFIIDNISNYDDINLNDQVYTSTLGNIHSSHKIGYVYKIEYSDIKKQVFVKSDVDFNDINYLYVVMRK